MTDETLLQDPLAVHLNMLRGTIAKPSRENILHLYPEIQSEIESLKKTLGAAEGYLLNAKIDLETGAPKKTAIRTIEGGLKVVRAVR